MDKPEEIFEHITENVITLVRSSSPGAAARMIGVDPDRVAVSTRAAAQEVFDTFPMESVMSAFVVDMDRPEEYWPTLPYSDSEPESESVEADCDSLDVLGPHLTKREKAWLRQLIKLMESGPESLSDKVSLFCGGDRSFDLYDLRRYIESVGYHPDRNTPDLVRELEGAGIESLRIRSPIHFESVAL